MRPLCLLFALIVSAAAACYSADAPAGRIVYPREEGGGYKLHVMNADGTGDRVLPGQTAAVNVYPAWSPDGKRIAFTTLAAPGEMQSQVCILNADGTGLVTINAPFPGAALISWSPDGRQIAFTCGPERRNVYVADADGNGARQLNPEGTGAAAIFWLRDGKTLGYTRFVDGQMMGGRVVLVKADGTGEEPLTQDENVLLVVGPNGVSPDGKRLAYVALDLPDRRVTLRTLELDGKVENSLGELDWPEAGFEAIPLPAWGPDSKSILVPGKTDNGRALFRVSEDGKTKTRLTPEGVNCLAGAWTAAP